MKTRIIESVTVLACVALMLAGFVAASVRVWGWM